MRMSLATFPFMSKQTVFEHIVNHLISQNERSLTMNGVSAYRGKRGLKCAAGSLIADDEYTPSMEGKLWSQLVNNGIAPSSYAGMITNLETIHDVFYPDPDWLVKIRDIANKEGLRVEFLNDVRNPL